MTMIRRFVLFGSQQNCRRTRNYRACRNIFSSSSTSSYQQLPVSSSLQPKPPPSPQQFYYTTTTTRNGNSTVTIRDFSSSSNNVNTNTNNHNQRKAREIWFQSIYDDNVVYDDGKINNDDDDDNVGGSRGISNSSHQKDRESNDRMKSTMNSDSLQPPSQPSHPHWKEWFLPQEYENPWDMIHVTHAELSQSRFRRAPHLSSSTSSTNDTVVVSSSSSTMSMEQFARNLDYMSKHGIMLLQNYHNFTLTAQNSITTEYGNVLLHRLLQLVPTHTTTSSSSSSSVSSSTNTSTSTNATTNTEKATIIANRAFMILQNMEFTDGTVLMIPNGTKQLLLPSPPTSSSASSSKSHHIRRQRRPRQHPNDSHHVSLDQESRNESMDLKDHDPYNSQINHHHNSSNSISNSDNSNTTSISKNHSRSHRLPRTIPKPNRDTYNTILLLLSRTSGSYIIPQMAQVIVEQMEYRYNVLQELDVKVTNYHYNCILLAWSLCIEYDKCLYATQLLIYNATRSHGHEIVDASSYIHVLRICANHVKLSHPSPNTTTTNDASTSTNDIATSTNRITLMSNPNRSKPQAPTITPQQQQLQLLGANVAIQLWKQMFEQNATTTTTSSYSERGAIGSAGTVGSSLLNSHHDTSLKTILTQYLSDEERHTPLYIPDLPPHFYSHFLQAIRSLPVVYPSQYNYNNNNNNNNNNNDNRSNNTNKYSIRDLYYMKCMDHAIENGKVNTYVLQEFFVHVKNKDIFDMFLGEYRSQIYGMHPNDAVQHLISLCVPKSWYRNIETSTHKNSSSVNSNNN